MVYLVALLIFAALSAACSFVSVALYRSTFDGPDPAAPRYRAVAAAATPRLVRVRVAGAGRLERIPRPPSGWTFPYASAAPG